MCGLVRGSVFILESDLGIEFILRSGVNLFWGLVSGLYSFQDLSRESVFILRSDERFIYTKS